MGAATKCVSLVFDPSDRTNSKLVKKMVIFGNLYIDENIRYPQGSKAVDSRHFAFRASEGRETVDIGPQYIY